MLEDLNLHEYVGWTLTKSEKHYPYEVNVLQRLKMKQTHDFAEELKLHQYLNLAVEFELKPQKIITKKCGTYALMSSRIKGKIPDDYEPGGIMENGKKIKYKDMRKKPKKKTTSKKDDKKKDDKMNDSKRKNDKKKDNKMKTSNKKKRNKDDAFDELEKEIKQVYSKRSKKQNTSSNSSKPPKYPNKDKNESPKGKASRQSNASTSRRMIDKNRDSDADIIENDSDDRKEDVNMKEVRWKVFN